MSRSIDTVESILVFYQVIASICFESITGFLIIFAFSIGGSALDRHHHQVFGAHSILSSFQSSRKDSTFVFLLFFCFAPLHCTIIIMIRDIIPQLVSHQLASYSPSHDLITL